MGTRKGFLSGRKERPSQARQCHGLGRGISWAAFLSRCRAWFFCPLAPEAVRASGPGAHPGPPSLHSATTGIPVILGLIGSPLWRRGQSQATLWVCALSSGKVFRGWGPAASSGALSSFSETRGGCPLSTRHRGPRGLRPLSEEAGCGGAHLLPVSVLHLLCHSQWLLQPPRSRSPGYPFTRVKAFMESPWPLGEFYYLARNSQSGEEW